MKHERAAVVASDGDAAIKSQKLSEGDKAEAGKVKRIVKVSQTYIDRLIEEEAAGGRKVPTFDRVNKFTGRGADALRALVARSSAAFASIRDHDAMLLNQYRTFGEAYDEVEEESWLDDEAVCGPLAGTWRKTIQPPATS